jgi:hypothetical protein
MGWSPLTGSKPSDTAVIGDEPYDLISQCFRDVAETYQRDLKRMPALRELVGTVKAVLKAQLQDVTFDGATAELVGLTFKTRRIRRRQKYAVGDILESTAANGEPIYARIFENSEYGPEVGVYDSLGMSPKDLDALIRRPLIVKVFPMHREFLEKRGWRVIGTRPLSKADKKLPRGTLSIFGINAHLEFANYHYGFEEAAFRDVDRFLVGKRRGTRHRRARDSAAG